METTIYLARLFAIMYLAVGIGLLLNRSHYEQLLREFLNNPALLYLAGLVVLILGFLIVSIHNEWGLGWPLIITILGWAIMIKGIVILAAPRAILALSHSMISKSHFAIWEGLLAIGFGLVMAYIGFLRY